MANLLIQGKAEFSLCGMYRYTLERRWALPGAPRRLCTFIMLNPSTGDEYRDDPTTRRCMAFARETGHDRYAAVNLFAYRAARPVDMIAAKDPVGPENDAYIRRFASKAKARGMVICAWGTDGAHMGREKAVLALLASIGVEPLCLRTTNSGHPEHPLYIPAPWRPVAME
ncbi:MAG: DUF1643 domain-containing protein [Alphaproteobacteria bacterium]